MGRSVFVLLFLASCGRLGFGSEPSPDALADAPADAPIDVELGLLTVTSSSDASPAPDGMSLRDALLAAAADPAPNHIVFDPRVHGTTITLGSSLAISGPSTILDGHGSGVVLATASGFTGSLLDVTADNVTIDGLILTGSGTAISSSTTSGLVVRRIAIRDTSGDGIHLEQCTNVVLEDGRIERPVGDPILARASSTVRIQRMFVALLSKAGSVHGIFLDQSDHVQVLDNIVDPGEAFMIALQDASDNELSGNIVDGGDSGIVLLGTSSRNLVIRNVVIQPLYDSVYVEGAADANTVVHNTFYMAGDVVNGGTNTTAANNLISSTSTDFVDPPAYDFHLVAGCPLIDSATDLGFDLLPGQPERFLGVAPDLGGVESY